MPGIAVVIASDSNAVRETSATTARVSVLYAG
jgi:hypothetical protein